jgi:hypothetical protein
MAISDDIKSRKVVVVIPIKATIIEFKMILIVMLYLFSISIVYSKRNKI